MNAGLLKAVLVTVVAVYASAPALGDTVPTPIYAASQSLIASAASSAAAATTPVIIEASSSFATFFASEENTDGKRTFRLNAHAPEFLLDGRPFRFIGGSFHYFRSLPGTWQQKLRTMRAAGLNVLTTYVEWSLHNPHDGVYTFEGAADVVRFIRLAEAEGFLVVLRPGPYICAERDAGGFPHWLLTKYPHIRMRTMDADYLREVQRWYAELMPRMWPLLYENGGPVIMVSVENEYGSYKCDVTFRRWMREETERHVRGKALLFTNDGPSQTKCGKIPGVLGTLDFGAGDAATINSNWAQLRRYEPTGPLVNMEYYPGWLSHWQEPMARVATAPVVRTLRQMLAQNASVNFYMFYGGTNFGFTAGANNFGPGAYDADLTSYDYDAPMDEAGDPTAKYHALRAVIGEYLPLPDVPVPQPLPKWRRSEPVLMSRVAELLTPIARRHLGTQPLHAVRPNVSFEQLNQHSGFVLYEAQLPAAFNTDPAVLHVEKLHDRAVVLVDGAPVGLLSREQKVADVALPAAWAGGKVQLLVENQGRINFNVMEDFKGILGRVQLAGKDLLNWTMTGYPLESYKQIEALIAEVQAAGSADEEHNAARPSRICAPTVYRGTFDVDSNERLYDTYLDPRGWGKGVAFVNGFNVGRYWPLVGPQRTLYVPVELLRHGGNELTLVELERCAVGATLALVDKPILD